MSYLDGQEARVRRAAIAVPHHLLGDGVAEEQARNVHVVLKPDDGHAQQAPVTRVGGLCLLHNLWHTSQARQSAC